jgi:hypothetical protein
MWPMGLLSVIFGAIEHPMIARGKVKFKVCVLKAENILKRKEYI